MPEILVNLSNRHIHLSQEDLDRLFGRGYRLQNIKDLVQPGQFAAAETVSIAGPKGELKNVRILGPIRSKTQCEIMQSDTHTLSIFPPVRESGCVEGTSPFTVAGPAGRLEKREGLMIPCRHIHLDPRTAEAYGLRDRQGVSIELGIEGRRVLYKDVIVRVNPNFKAECHLDFDEGNAAGIGNGSTARIIACGT